MLFCAFNVKTWPRPHQSGQAENVNKNTLLRSTFASDQACLYVCKFKGKAKVLTNPGSQILCWLIPFSQMSFRYKV